MRVVAAGDVGQLPQVGQRARAVGDVGEQHQRDRAVAQLLLERLRLRAVQRVAVQQPQLEPALLGQALEHVAVGREVVAVGDDGALRRQPVGVERRRAELEQVDGGRVGDDHLARPRAEHALGQQVADARRRVDPVRPAGDEPLAPLLDEVAQPVARGHRQPAERVAVEVDPLLVGEHEPLAEAGQRVGRVERGGVARGSAATPSPPPSTSSPARGARSGSRRRSRRARTRRPPRRAAAANSREMWTGTSSSRSPCTSSSGTPIGSRRRGEAGVVAVRDLVGRAAEQLVDDARRTCRAARARRGRARPPARPRRSRAPPPPPTPRAGRRPSARSPPRARPRAAARGSPPRCPRTSPASRRRRRAAGTRCSTPPSRAPRGRARSRPPARGRSAGARSRRGRARRPGPRPP